MSPHRGDNLCAVLPAPSVEDLRAYVVPELPVERSECSVRGHGDLLACRLDHLPEVADQTRNLGVVRRHHRCWRQRRRFSQHLRQLRAQRLRGPLAWHLLHRCPAPHRGPRFGENSASNCSIVGRLPSSSFGSFSNSSVSDSATTGLVRCRSAYSTTSLFFSCRARPRAAHGQPRVASAWSSCGTRRPLCTEGTPATRTIKRRLGTRGGARGATGSKSYVAPIKLDAARSRRR